MKRNAGLLLVLVLAPALLVAQSVAFDYSKIFEEAQPAIVTVSTDDGSGSGFLVTPWGHIATNYHVVQNSRYLAVQFADGRKVRAEVVAANPQYDMALLKVNSAIVENIRPLPILPKEEEYTIKVGVPVVAIGSPLNQNFLMTQGILSKVDDLTLLGDFLLQAGNSGGPLLNRKGEVIGINTFGEANIAGAVRVAVLRAFVESPGLIETSYIEPSPDPLPSLSPHRYPVEILNHKAQREGLDWEAYRFEAGDFAVTVITPVLIAKLQVMQDKMQRGGKLRPVNEPYFEWHRATESALDYAITFDIRPEASLTPRSKLSRILAPFFFGKSGPRDMEFKAEFLDFRIYRDGELIQPIMPGRQVIEGSTDPHKNRHSDRVYSGAYVYSPDEFQRGNEFRIEVYNAKKPKELHKQLIFKVDSKLIRQLRADFSVNPDFFSSKVP